jgi:pimeloyl-ACP methyl ester carboxylesterase/DNA-binding CsgD family transcriptional regulator
MSIARPQIRFCTSADGTRIAVASLGDGPPLVRTAHWLSHVEFDGRSPVWAHWLRELSRAHTYIRYDPRGCGLSDRTPPQNSLEAWIEDLEAVVALLGLRRFPLLGMSQGAAVAIAYAARHPDKVSHLLLCGAYARGTLRRDLTEQQRREAALLLDLIRLGWGRDNPAFRQVFTSLFIPGGSHEQHQWFNDLERVSAAPEAAAAMLEVSYQVDVSALAERVRVPTTVFHVREDARVPFDEGRVVAALIPGARFVPLEGRNHILLEDDPAWRHFLAELRACIGEPDDALDEAGLTPAEHAVLTLVARGLDNAAIASALGKREKTVRNQVSALLGKLGARTRAEAIVLARDASPDR